MTLELLSRMPPAECRPTPILFVHGAWHGAWCWDDAFMPYFAGRGYRCYALSWRGHGKSPGRERIRWFRLHQYVADVSQMADRIEAETGSKPVLVGHSLGGAVVQKLLETYRAPAAVLLASVPIYGTLPALVTLTLRHPLAGLRTFLTLNGWHLVSTPARARTAFFSAEISDQTLEKHFARLGPESLIGGAIDGGLLQLPRPGRVKSPMLVLGATRDTIFSRRAVEITGRAYNSPAEFFDMAHDMMLEPGWSAVTNRILAWLSERGL